MGSQVVVGLDGIGVGSEGLPYGSSAANPGPRRRPSLGGVGVYLRSCGATRTIAPPWRILTALPQAQLAEPPL